MGEAGKNIITMNMPDSERAEILRNTDIEVVEYNSNESPLADETVNELENTYKSKAHGILKELCSKFGIFKDYSNKNVSLEFNYSGRSLDESVYKASKRGVDFSDFAKMLSVFDAVISNDDKNKMYVSVTMKKVEADLIGMPPNAEHSTKIPKSTSTYSLSRIIENINPSDGEFLKYIPDELLNEEQLQSKKEALEHEKDRLEEMRTEYLKSTVSEETVSERKKATEKLCKHFGLSFEWSDSVKRGKYDPDTRTVTLNPELTLREMYLEVLKHEFTHDLENRKLYKGFKKYLFGNSKAFTEYCETKLRDEYKIEATGGDAVLILRGIVYKNYKNSSELNEKEREAFDREAAEREMVADFVAERLITGENEAAAIEALREFAVNEPTVFERFIDWIRDILYRIKDGINKTTLTDELEYLERRLKKVYRSEVDKKKTAQGGSKHSIAIDSEGYYVKVDVEQKLFDGKSIQEQQDIAKKIIKNNFKNKVLKVGDVMSKGEVKIKVTDRGYIFYDITQIEKLPVNGGQTVLNTAAASGSSSTDIIDPNKPTVNSNSMRDGENNTFDIGEFTGFSEVDVSEDNVSYETKLFYAMRGETVTTEQQAYVKRIGKSLGSKVVFETVFTPDGNHADGFEADDGSIHIDYHCKNPVNFVFKHELTHYGESSPLYEKFCRAVMNSKAFKDWIGGKIKEDI